MKSVLLNIAVVDDDKVTRTLVRSVLAKAGHQIFEFDSGAPFLAAIESKAIDLVLLDVQMPSMDGLTVLDRLRGEKSSQIPVLMMTAHSELETVKSAQELGVTDFIVKPIVPQLLHERIGPFAMSISKEEVVKILDRLRFPEPRISRTVKKIVGDRDCYFLIHEGRDILVAIRKGLLPSAVKDFDSDAKETTANLYLKTMATWHPIWPVEKASP